MSPRRSTELLIIGAGPFGLAMAAHARHLGVDHVIAGEPMQFWRAHMPDGMYLRSDARWHLDPENTDTIDAFLQTRGLTAADCSPLSREMYLDYTRWFQDRKQIDPYPALVERLDGGDGHGRFHATMADGSSIGARHVLLAPGFAPFAHVPGELARQLPGHRLQHTCDFVEFTRCAGLRYLIVGGRQSAFEWAALMAEAGAAEVHVSHRHESPAFAAADWDWVDPLVERFVEDPGWYRRLSETEKDGLGRRLWAEGRLKLEPWLEPRVRRESIRTWPNTCLAACAESESALAITLDGAGGSRVLEIDRVVLATGYKVDVARVPLLARGNLLARLQRDNGCPLLDDNLQSSIPGLFMTSMLAVRDFGPFLAFTVSARASAKLVGRALRPRR
jgi:FAD-dependent urate hydroxylase